MKSIVFTGFARRPWRRLPEVVRQSLMAALVRYAETGYGDVIRLKGQPRSRLRWGDYRIVFAETAELIEVHAVGHRKDVYT